MKRGNKKEKKLQSVGLESHHITPLHYSAKLKASMSPEQWAERVRSDAEQGVHHGHHHKNLMGTVISKTPERFRKRGITHRAGGAHDASANAITVALTGSTMTAATALWVTTFDLRVGESNVNTANSSNVILSSASPIAVILMINPFCEDVVSPPITSTLYS